MSERNKHTDTLEYALATTVWRNAANQDAKNKAINYYKMACDKNDGAAYFALYKIKVDNADLALQKQDRLNINAEYLEESINLGYLPALLYAGTAEIYTKFNKLVFLAAGMAYSHKNNLKDLDSFLTSFASQSEEYAIELIPEIIKLNETWVPGNVLDNDLSHLDGKLIHHPDKYDSELDIKRQDWNIFEKSESTEFYLNQLPGAKDYFEACESERRDNTAQWNLLMESAKVKGNGQAMYALSDHTKHEDLLRAAQYGSIDAYIDIINKLNEYFEKYKYERKYEYEFYNTARIVAQDEEAFLSAINCFLYIYSIMERLGIEKYCESSIQVVSLSTETESGYAFWKVAAPEELKYELCSHGLCCQMNNRAQSWRLGDDFDAIFHKNFEDVMHQ